MDKTDKLKNAGKQVTYWNVINAFNNLNKDLGGEFYASSTNLKTPDGKTVPGFVYTGYAAGVGIRRILDSVNIKYVTFMKGGSGIEENSEIHIEDPESKKIMLDILEKTGAFQSNINREINTMNSNSMNNPLFQTIGSSRS